MKKMNKAIKRIKWQDVTDEMLLECYDEDVLKLRNRWEKAAYQNSYAYNVAGCGIDVRSKYADEVVGIWKLFIRFDEIKHYLEECGWTCRKDNRANGFLSMEKGNEYIEIEGNNGENGDTGYLMLRLLDETEFSGEFTDFYDEEEETPEDVISSIIYDTLKRIPFDSAVVEELAEKMYEDVLTDVKETSDYPNYNNTDVELAVARTLTKMLGFEI